MKPPTPTTAYLVKYWFFKHLNLEQRHALFRTFGMPVDEIGESTIIQSRSLEFILKQLAAPHPTKPQGEMGERAAKERIDNAGYVRAFYELAGLMGLNAQAASPREVWETEMKPWLERALSTGGKRS